MIIRLSAAAEAAFAGGFIFPKEPEADGNLRAVEELAGEGDHAVHEVGLDEGAADVAFAGLVGGHAAIGEDEAGHADGGGGGVRGVARFGAGHEGVDLPRQRRVVDAHAASLIWRFRAAQAGFGTTDFTDDTDGRVTVMWWR